MLREIMSGVTHTGTHFNMRTHSIDNAMNINGIFIRNNLRILLNNDLLFIAVMVLLAQLDYKPSFLSLVMMELFFLPK